VLLPLGWLGRVFYRWGLVPLGVGVWAVFRGLGYLIRLGWRGTYRWVLRPLGLALAWLGRRVLLPAGHAVAWLVRAGGAAVRRMGVGIRDEIWRPGRDTIRAVFRR